MPDTTEKPRRPRIPEPTQYYDFRPEAGSDWLEKVTIKGDELLGPVVLIQFKDHMSALPRNEHAILEKSDHLTKKRNELTPPRAAYDPKKDTLPGNEDLDHVLAADTIEDSTAHEFAFNVRSSNINEILDAVDLPQDVRKKVQDKLEVLSKPPAQPKTR